MTVTAEIRINSKPVLEMFICSGINFGLFFAVGYGNLPTQQAVCLLVINEAQIVHLYCLIVFIYLFIYFILYSRQLLLGLTSVSQLQFNIACHLEILNIFPFEHSHVFADP